MKKRILSEKNCVVLLFVLVLVTFSLAQEDTKKIESLYFNINSSATSQNNDGSPEVKTNTAETGIIIPSVQLR